MLIERKNTGILLVVSAPSGGGKTTILNEAIKVCPDLKRSTSYTTRPSRKGEENGVDYHYVTEPEFKAMVERGEFLEWAAVYGYLYGTPLKPIEENMARGLDTALAIDIQGARSIRKRFSHSVLIFVTPPSLDELERRLKSRGPGSAAYYAARLERAEEEISLAAEYDYIIVNRHLEESVAQLAAVVAAERLRVSRYLIHTGEGGTG